MTLFEAERNYQYAKEMRRTRRKEWQRKRIVMEQISAALSLVESPLSDSFAQFFKQQIKLEAEAEHILAQIEQALSDAAGIMQNSVK